jgi:hypothetical protein
MTHNQVFPQVSRTSLRRRLVVSAASIAATGALVGAGAAAAFAASPATTPREQSDTSASVSQSGVAPVLAELRQAFFSGTLDGARAQKAADALVADTAVFSQLPAGLQSDLTALKGAPAAQRLAEAAKIRSTALAGGYGTEIEGLAAALQNGSLVQSEASLLSRLRTDLASGASAGRAAADVAGTLLSRPSLAASLPANLRSDLAALKNAPAPDQDADAQKIETSALAGGYGQQIEKIAEGIQAALAGSGLSGSATGGATGSTTGETGSATGSASGSAAGDASVRSSGSATDSVTGATPGTGATGTLAASGLGL